MHEIEEIRLLCARSLRQSRERREDAALLLRGHRVATLVLAAFMLASAMAFIYLAAWLAGLVA